MQDVPDILYYISIFLKNNFENGQCSEYAFLETIHNSSYAVLLNTHKLHELILD
jgi:hypothetical protein